MGDATPKPPGIRAGAPLRSAPVPESRVHVQATRRRAKTRRIAGRVLRWALAAGLVALSILLLQAPGVLSRLLGASAVAVVAFAVGVWSSRPTGRAPESGGPLVTLPAVVGTPMVQPPTSPEPVLAAVASDVVSAMATTQEIVPFTSLVEPAPTPEPVTTRGVPAPSGSYWDRIGTQREPVSPPDPKKDPHDPGQRRQVRQP
jgi:hypothetical protein